jgi:transposase-like protein
MPRSSRRIVRAFKQAHTAEIKFRAVLDVMRCELSLAEVARVYEVSPSTLKQWKARFLELGSQIFTVEQADQADGRVVRAQKRAAEAYVASARLSASASEHAPETPPLSALLRRQAD